MGLDNEALRLCEFSNSRADKNAFDTSEVLKSSGVDMTNRSNPDNSFLRTLRPLASGLSLPLSAISESNAHKYNEICECTSAEEATGGGGGWLISGGDGQI